MWFRAGAASPRHRRSTPEACSSTFEDFLHAEELTVAPAFWRVRERLLVRESRARLVVAADAVDRQRRRARRHCGGVDFGEAIDRLEHDGDLPREPVDLGVSEGDARETGNVNDGLAVDGHTP